MNIERRFFAVAIESRSAEDNRFVASGHFATFNQPYGVFDFREQIAPGAFDEVLDDPDTLALWNHNPDNVLGSVGSRTVELAVDETGPVSTIIFPASALREREAIERGDVRKMSFGFSTGEDRWERHEDGTELRTILKVSKLWDVSPVAYPANPTTDIGMAQRSRDAWRASNPPSEAWKLAHAHRSRQMQLAGY